MRLEDKELEGPDLERAQRLEVLEQTEESTHELPELAHEEVVDLELVHRSRLFDALQLILAGEALEIPLLYLPQRETRALEFLQAAVTGRDSGMGTFVFAEDRASLLEQALAVLQQNLTHGKPAELAELHSKFDKLTGEVADLRAHLVNLEDAQDEIMEPRAHRIARGDAGETADNDESVTGFIASALQALAVVAGTDVQTLRSTLDGPERAEVPKLASTLDLPERPERAIAKPASTLVGGTALPDRPTAASTLDGFELPAKPAIPSTLDLPERPELSEQAAKRTTLLTDGMSKLIVPPERRSSPTIEPPRNKFPSVAPPIRSGRATTPPAGTVMTYDPPEPDKPAPRRGLSIRSTEKPKGKK